MLLLLLSWVGEEGRERWPTAVSTTAVTQSWAVTRGITTVKISLTMVVASSPLPLPPPPPTVVAAIDEADDDEEDDAAVVEEAMTTIRGITKMKTSLTSARAAVMAIDVATSPLPSASADGDDDEA